LTHSLGLLVPRRSSVRSWAGAAVLAVLLVFACASVASADTITGTSGPDGLVGTSGSDVISGLGGNDIIFGMGGNDQLNGGTGDDILQAGSGTSTLTGGGGFDILIAGAGTQQLIGGDQADLLEPNAGSDTSNAGAGNNLVIGGPGANAVTAAGGSDVLMDSVGGGSIAAGAGNDLIIATSHTSAESIDAGSGTDICYVETADTPSGCETVVRVAGNGPVPTLTWTGGPRQDSTLNSDHTTFTFSATNDQALFCTTDTATAPVRCDSGSFSDAGLTPGTHTLIVTAAPNYRVGGVALMRRFNVVVPPPVIYGFAVTGNDQISLAGGQFTGMDSLVFKASDGSQFTESYPGSHIVNSTWLYGPSLVVTDQAFGSVGVPSGRSI